jgi:RimJ/RimL family protein N-acetyltransferase
MLGRCRHNQAVPATIRPAVPADLDHLVEMWWSVAAEGRWVGTEVPFDRQARRAGLADLIDRDSATLLVADVLEATDTNTESVGNLSVQIARYGVADIGMLIIDGWRGQGIGTALLDAGLDWARTAGAHKAALEVWPHNEAALALYRRAGFVEEGRKRRHYRRANGELWDAILMGLPLT